MSRLRTRRPRRLRSRPTTLLSSGCTRPERPSAGRRTSSSCHARRTGRRSRRTSRARSSARATAPTRCDSGRHRRRGDRRVRQCGKPRLPQRPRNDRASAAAETRSNHDARNTFLLRLGFLLVLMTAVVPRVRAAAAVALPTGCVCASRRGDDPRVRDGGRLRHGLRRLARHRAARALSRWSGALPPRLLEPAALPRAAHSPQPRAQERVSVLRLSRSPRTRRTARAAGATSSPRARSARHRAESEPHTARPVEAA